MKIIGTIPGIQSEINKANLSPLGFVPTMGALHDGHISLVRSAVGLCPVVVVSIYVNPTQFNDKNDLSNYPRTLGDDLKLLETVLRENDIVFTPVDKEIYPAEDKRVFNFGNLDNVMEALHRPGHFNGVGQVVSRLFDIVKPDKAIFGQKDFQQLAVIRSLVKQYCYPVEIIGHPIIREADGLAMSSRNRLLDPESRLHAPEIYRTISAASVMIRNNETDEMRAFVRDRINKLPGFRLEYFEIADDDELIPVNRRKEMKNGKQYYGCIAVYAGKIRLIDNIKMNLPE
jgi:pantoate--beta-alanine ligase